MRSRRGALRRGAHSQIEGISWPLSFSSSPAPAGRRRGRRLHGSRPASDRRRACSTASPAPSRRRRGRRLRPRRRRRPRRSADPGVRDQAAAVGTPSRGAAPRRSKSPRRFRRSRGRRAGEAGRRSPEPEPQASVEAPASAEEARDAGLNAKTRPRPRSRSTKTAPGVCRRSTRSSGRSRRPSRRRR